jgi:2-phospho-L-lactate guanylyltransferase
MIVLIPCKSLSAGKSRLQTYLDAAQRQKLCGYFLTRTIELATAVAGAERVRIVTSDPEAVSIAARASILSLPDAHAGLNAALTSARDGIMRGGLSAQRLMILPIDLPYATAESLAQATKSKADVVINPDESRRGTNLLVLSAAVEVFRFSFGEDSFGAHSNQARAAGLDLQITNDPRLARDIDELEQYTAWTKSATFPRQLMSGAQCVQALARKPAAS